MAEFMQERIANIFAKEFVIGFGHVPNVLEVKDDLLWHGRGVHLFRKVRSDKKPECVLLNAVRDQFAGGFALINDRDAFGLLAQGRGEPLQNVGDLALGQRKEARPIQVRAHGEAGLAGASNGSSW